MPTILLGANVAGKPNYMNVAWVGIMDYDFVSVSVARKRHTHTGIKENRTFSINIPTLAMMRGQTIADLFPGGMSAKAGFSPISMVSLKRHP